MFWVRRLFKSLGSGPKDPLMSGARAAPVGGDEAAAGATLERAIAEHRARNWTLAEPLFRSVIANPAASAHDRQVSRNILGNLLERNRRTEEAIAVYEANLAERFTGSYPYERLAAIYRKHQRPQDELRVLRRAVAVIRQELASGRPDVAPQLGRLETALAEALARQGSSTADR